MISALNRLVDLVEEHLGTEWDLGTVAGRLGTTEYHLRRMFSSLAGMPLSEYVRRRRMTVAAGDVIRGADDLLSIASMKFRVLFGAKLLAPVSPEEKTQHIAPEELDRIRRKMEANLEDSAADLLIEPVKTNALPDVYPEEDGKGKKE